MRDAECVELLRWALPRLGLRWDGFRRVRGQVCKRIARRMTALGLARASEYRARLQSQAAEWSALDELCRVTISRFFRDRAVWERLRDDVLPRAARLALRGGTTLWSWSAGCASGEEPYGLSILFHLGIAPAFPGLRLRVLATDAEEAVLERARRGCYPPGALRPLPSDWVARAFELRGGLLCLRPEYREPVELVRQDLRRALPEGPFHLVLCRNLAFTYFDERTQRQVLDEIAARLVPGGFLVVGAHEALPAAGVLEPAAGRLPIHFRPEEEAAGRE